MIMMITATHMIVIALKAILVIDMITGTAIASQLLMTKKAKVTMPNTTTNLDLDQDHDQGPLPMILEAQDTIMVTTFIMMTTGVENGCAHPLLLLVQVQIDDHPLLEPNHLWFNIKTRLLN